MEKIKISPSLVKVISEDLNQKLTSNHISNVTIVNSSDIVLTFSFYRKEKLFISLRNNSPYIALLENIDSLPTMENGFSSKLRQQIRDSFILGVEQINEDNIICFHLRVNRDGNYIDKDMYIELISHHPLLLVINKEDDAILFATHYDEEERKIILKEKYVLPEKHFTFISEYNDLMQAYKYANNLYKNSLILRKKEKFAKIFKYLEKRKKTLNKKLNVLNDEIYHGNMDLIYKDLGDACYSMELDDLKDYYASLNRKYDEGLSQSDNAQMAFKRYKKAKSKIVNANEQLEKAREEINYIEHLYTQTQFASEEDMLQMEHELFKHEKVSNRKNKTEPTKFKPYVYKGDGFKILFGKNDLQNEYLTFKVASYKDYFLHIHNYPGAHVILQGDKIGNKELELAAQVALLLSNKQDGDVSYAKVKDCKKGNKTGLVILKSYQLIHIKNINKEAKEILKNASKN